MNLRVLSRIASCAAAALLAAASAASATTIDFTDQTQGSNPSPFVYAQATFSSSTGTIYVGASTLASEICALTTQFDCTGTITVSFTTPVNGLSFQTSGDQDAAANVFATVTTTSGTFMYTGDSDGDPLTFDPQNLSSYANVTGLSLTSSDPAGVAYDYFTFTPAPIPESSAWILMIAGIGGIGLAMRQAKAGVGRWIGRSDTV